MGDISEDRKAYTEVRNNLKTHIFLKLHIHRGLAGGSLSHLPSGNRRRENPSLEQEGEKRALGVLAGPSKTWSRNNTHHFSQLLKRNGFQDCTQP